MQTRFRARSISCEISDEIGTHLEGISLCRTWIAFIILNNYAHLRNITINQYEYRTYFSPTLSLVCRVSVKLGKFQNVKISKLKC